MPVAQSHSGTPVCLHRLLICSSLVVFLLGTFAVQNIPAQTPETQDDEVVRVDSDLTNLFFTATDKQKRFITTLREADVQVVEDGVTQQILLFQRETDRPVSLAFLIDVSASEARTLGQLKAAARSFIEAVIRSKDDEAAIIPFTERAFLEQPFTRNLLGLYHVLSQVDVALPLYFGLGRPIGGIVSGPGMAAVPAQGTTAIWDAIAVSSSEVMAQRSGSRRRAIILLTDGRDTSSRLKKSAAIERAIAAETVIYAIGIGDEKLEGVDKGPLQNVAEATGGRAFFPKKEMDLKNAFADIESELRSQYLVAYSSTNKNRDGAFRQTRIEITNPELRPQQLKLRHRPGYIAKPLVPGKQKTQEK
jgi:Ca-activated chloride channel homolog